MFEFSLLVSTQKYKKFGERTAYETTGGIFLLFELDLPGQAVCRFIKIYRVCGGGGFVIMCSVKITLVVFSLQRLLR